MQKLNSLKVKMQKNKNTKKYFSASQLFSFSAERGYTIIEMLAVVFMITILMGTTLYNYSRHRDDEVILFETQKLAQYLRRAQNLALSPQLGEETVSFGFGVYINIASGPTRTIILFKDLDNDYIYDAPGEKIGELILDQRVQIQSSGLQAPVGTSQSVFSVVYTPPDPTFTIYNASANTNAAVGRITVTLASDVSKTRVINFNSVGLVEVQ